MSDKRNFIEMMTEIYAAHPWARAGDYAAQLGVLVQYDLERTTEHLKWLETYHLQSTP